MPMSVMNYDRHGMENLRHDPVKPFDRIKMPPAFLYLFFMFLFGMMYDQRRQSQELDITLITTKNMLLAMKEGQKMTYAPDEVTATEQLTMHSN